MYCKCFQLPRMFVKSFALTQPVLVQVLNHEKHIPKRWAGHAKWQNIKSTKESNDKQKSESFQRLTQMIRVAVKEGGPNINTNYKLKKIFDESQKINMPKATFEKALKNCIAKSEQKPYWIVFTGPGGLVLGLEVTFSKNTPQYLQSIIGPFTKKIGLKIETHYNDQCSVKGVIIADALPNIVNTYEKAIEDAIEIGVDEVFKNNDKSLIFECPPNRVDSIVQQLSNRGYNILSASAELDFQNVIKLDSEKVKNLETVIEKIQGQFQEVIRASYNVNEQ